MLGGGSSDGARVLVENMQDDCGRVHCTVLWPSPRLGSSLPSGLRSCNLGNSRLIRGGYKVLRPWGPLEPWSAAQELQKARGP